MKMNWPQPVLLKRIQEGPLQVRIWNPQLYPSDKQHKMPIITPAYPSMCATHNVSSSTQAVMTEEFARAAEIADKIMIGTAEWKDLFEQNDFFHKYKNYVYVICSSSNKDTQLKWSGMVESKVRQLVNKLEAIEELEIAHPYIKGFERSFVVNSEEEFHEIAHGKFPDLMGKEGQLIDEDSVAEYEATADDPRRPIFTTTFYIGLKVKSKDKSVSSVATKKMDIGWPSNEFIKLVKLWDKYEEDCMYVYVTPIKGVNLPKDVLGDQPRVLKKKTKSKRTNLASNPDEVINGSKRLKLSSEIGGDDPETPLAISNELIPEEDEQKMGLDDTKTGTKGDEIIPESIVEFESEDIEKEKGIELRKSSPTINIQSSGPVYSGLGSRAAQSKKFGGIKFKRN
ncbi:polynucleotide adenylyltransferase [Clydaea vesicula]|uniref:polynucleotide adenylyltransferase n=1 Tax=Clydaea vesicula TaxID=447962 RepID=A0AAD5U7D4_9FUNG|nr:polynucleotide adenylyltransferase [Clydaea vesicula]